MGISRCCLQAQPGASLLLRGWEQPQLSPPFPSQGTFPDLGEQTTTNIITEPSLPQTMPCTAVPNPPTPHLALSRVTGLQHRGLSQRKPMGGA